ncbi:hypothetical protein YC2023_033533 [Brassica napus]
MHHLISLVLIGLSTEPFLFEPIICLLILHVCLCFSLCSFLVSIFFLLGSSIEDESRIDWCAPCLEPIDLIEISSLVVLQIGVSVENVAFRFKTYVLSDLSCWSSKHGFLFRLSYSLWEVSQVVDLALLASSICFI